MKQPNTTRQVVGDALQLGVSIVLAIFVGFGLGFWLDEKFGTLPILSIIGFLFGVAAAGLNVWKAVKKELKSYEDKKGK